MEQTPLFQLNLFLWLTWPSAPTSVIRPVFREQGFVVRAIGQSVTPRLDIRAKLSGGNIPFKVVCNPDLLLEHSKNMKLVFLECKLNSFGSEGYVDDSSHPVRQLIPLLSTNGLHLAEDLGLVHASSWESGVLYAVSGEREDLMFNTLCIIGEMLESTNIPIANYASLGIYIRDDGIYLRGRLERLPSFSLEPLEGQDVRVMTLGQGEDPRPLYLIPWDPSISSDFYEQNALKERIRIAVASLIGSQLDNLDFQIPLEEFLRNTIEVWDRWTDKDAKKPLIRAVKDYILQIISIIKKLGVIVDFRQGIFAFSCPDLDVSRKARGYLDSASFWQGNIDLSGEAEQMELPFPDFNENAGAQP